MEILHTVQPIENLLNSKPAKISSGRFLLIKIRSYSTNILQIVTQKISWVAPNLYSIGIGILDDCYVQSDCWGWDGLVAVVVILRPLLVNLNRNYGHWLNSQQWHQTCYRALPCPRRKLKSLRYFAIFMSFLLSSPRLPGPWQKSWKHQMCSVVPINLHWDW